jgi:predicted transcriptional regulator
MAKRVQLNLSRRERQIMDLIFQRGRATAAEVMENLPDPPSYSAVRATLRILEEKGHVQHEQNGLRYVFVPTMARETAKRSALEHLLQTFFNGSAEQAVATLLDESASRLSEEELDRLAQLIEKARKNGR